jgi:hypothetical protein
MTSGRNVRRAVIGGNPTSGRHGLALALYLFSVTGLYAVVSHFVFDSRDGVVLLSFVLFGVLLSTAFAYRKSGLLVSWLLVLGPVCGPLAFYGWLTMSEQQAPVALVLSFYGHGAAAFWIPTALFLGSIGFGVGVLLRWVAAVR